MLDTYSNGSRKLGSIGGSGNQILSNINKTQDLEKALSGGYQVICGMKDGELMFINHIFDESIPTAERNEFVCQRFECMLKNKKTEEILKILKNPHLKNAHGSIIKTLVVLSAGFEKLQKQAHELDRYLIYQYGH